MWESVGLHACPNASDESWWLGPAVFEGLLKALGSVLPYVGLGQDLHQTQDGVACTLQVCGMFPRDRV